MTVSDGAFAAALRQEIGPWLAAGEQAILMSGMIGSRQGWQEAPYLPCPARIDALAQHCITVPFEGARIRIVPGLSLSGQSGDFDVMRGEETQIAGIATSPDFSGMVILPGSHSKHARVERGTISTFQSFMTGEVFAALRHHTILGRMMITEPQVNEAFRQGVERSTLSDSFLHRIFMSRTRVLGGNLREEDASSFLSGLVIGEELAGRVKGESVHLIGTAALCTLYAEAIRLLDGQLASTSEDAALAGLIRISRG